MEKSTKLMGAWGYIALIFCSITGGFFPFVNVLALAGAIVVLIAFVRASRELGRPEIRANAIIALILNVVAAVLFIFLVGAGITAAVLHHGHEMAGALFGTGVIFGGLIGWLLAITGGWFWYKASVPLAEATGVDLYKTGGLLIFIGAITIVVFGLGAIVMLIGEILQTVAFFSTPEEDELARAGGPT